MPLERNAWNQLKESFYDLTDFRNKQTWIQKLPFYIGILVSRSGEVQGHLEGGALGDSEGRRGEVAAA